MKKILLFVFGISFTSIVHAQLLDTIRIRNLTLPAENVAWIIGKLGEGTDSTEKDAFRRVRQAVQAANPPSWQTPITIDSLPGAIVFEMYKAAKSANAGEIVSQYVSITSTIAARTILNPWILPYDARLLQDYERIRDRGKNSVLDKTKGQ